MKIHPIVKSMIAAGIAGFLISGPVRADELEDLKARVQKMEASWAGQQADWQRQMEAMSTRHRDEIQLLQRQIASLEGAKSPVSVLPTPYQGGVLDRLVKNHIPSLRGEWLEIGGELEFEYLDTEADNNADGETTTAAAGSESDGRFQIDVFVLTTKINFSEDIYWKTNFEIEPGAPGSGAADTNTIDIDNSYLMVENVLKHAGLADPMNTYLSLGLKDPFEKSKRITENYSLLATAFNRDEELGIQMGGNVDPLYWRFSLSNGNELNDRSPNDVSSDFEIIEDNERNADENTNKEISFGLGINRDLGAMGKVDVLGFFNTAHLSNEDITFLRGVAGYSTGFEDDDDREAGLRVYYDLDNFHLWAMYVDAEDGSLERSAFSLDAFYKIGLPGIQRNGREYLTAVTPSLGYSRLDIDSLNHVVTDARTWDREKYVAALIMDLTQNIKLKLEYAFNDEETGGDEVDNDEFLGQLELKF